MPTFVHTPFYSTYSEPVTYVTPSSSVASNDGWGLLATGNARDARRVFDRQMRVYPTDGLAHIGYALASGMLNRHDEAVAVLREALRIDPDAILEVPRDQQLHEVLWTLLDAYLDEADAYPNNPDVHFIIAAMRFMMGDATLSFFAIDRAIDQGDQDVSTQNLRLMIREVMEQSAPPMFPSNTPATEPQPSMTPADSSWAIPL